MRGAAALPARNSGGIGGLPASVSPISQKAVGKAVGKGCFDGCGLVIVFDLDHTIIGEVGDLQYRCR